MLKFGCRKFWKFPSQKPTSRLTQKNFESQLFINYNCHVHSEVKQLEWEFLIVSAFYLSFFLIVPGLYSKWSVRMFLLTPAGLPLSFEIFIFAHLSCVETKSALIKNRNRWGKSECLNFSQNRQCLNFTRIKYLSFLGEKMVSFSQKSLSFARRGCISIFHQTKLTFRKNQNNNVIKNISVPTFNKNISISQRINSQFFTKRICLNYLLNKSNNFFMKTAVTMLFKTQMPEFFTKTARSLFFIK